MRQRITTIAAAVFISGCCATRLPAQAPGGISTGLTAWYKAGAGVTVTGGNVTAWANQAANPLVGNMTPSGPGTVSHITNDPFPFNFNNYMLYNNSVNMQFIAAGTGGAEVMPLNKGSMMAAGTSCNGVTVLNVTTGSQSSSGCGGPRCVVGMMNNQTAFSGDTRTGIGTAWLNSGGVANIFGLRGDATAPATKHENTTNGNRNTLNTFTTRGVGQYRLSLGSFPGYFYEAGGKIAESTCYNYQLTPDEFNRLESYYAIRYGVTLGSPAAPADYLSSASTVVWAGNTAYPYRITVIGRDDNGALLQKQSRSVCAGPDISLYNEDLAGVFPAMNADNTSTFAADQSFAAFGDNNADTALSVCAANGRVVRMQRVWKMQTTGTVGNVSIAIDAGTFLADIGSVIYSPDPVFPDAASAVATMTEVNGKKYAVVPAGNMYFTFGSSPLNPNGTVGPVVCDGANTGTVTLNPTGGVAPVTYSWNSSPVQTTQDLDGVPPGPYTVTITHGNGCHFDTVFTVAGSPAMQVAVTNTLNALCGHPNGSITFEADGGQAPYQYSFNGAAYNGQTSYNSLPAGTYPISVKDVNGCTADTSVVITNYTYSLDIADTAMAAWCDAGGSNGQLYIDVRNGSAPFNYFWHDLPQGTGNTMTGLSPGDYRITVTDAYGCSGDVDATVGEMPCCTLWLPNAFSPNGDGRNDVFAPVINVPVDAYTMEVFSRWGQRVFYSARSDKGWDGAATNGSPVEAGTYYYIVTYTCNMGTKPVVYKGDLTLIK